MKKCPRCGAEELRVLMWDGDRCGGHRTTCAKCGTVIEATEYYETGPSLYKVIQHEE
jgi:transposase-like protein